MCAAHDVRGFTLAGQGFGGSAAIVTAGALQALNARDVESAPLHTHGEKKRMAGNFEAISEFQKAIGAFRPDANGFLRSQNLHAQSPRRILLRRKPVASRPKAPIAF